MLIGILLVQSGAPTRVYAQNSIQEETQDLSDCLESLFADIQHSYQGKFGTDFVLTEEYRVGIVKVLLSILWDEKWSQLNWINGAGTIFALGVFTAAMITIKAPNVELANKVAELKKYLHDNRLDGKVLNTAGPNIKAQIESMEITLEQSKLSRWSRKIYPVALLLAALMILKMFNDNKNKEYVMPTYQDILKANQVSAILTALRQDIPVINDLRQKALDRCADNNILTEEDKTIIFQNLHENIKNPNFLLLISE